MLSSSHVTLAKTQVPCTVRHLRGAEDGFRPSFLGDKTWTRSRMVLKAYPRLGNLGSGKFQAHALTQKCNVVRDDLSCWKALPSIL